MMTSITTERLPVLGLNQILNDLLQNNEGLDQLTTKSITPEPTPVTTPTLADYVKAGSSASVETSVAISNSFIQASRQLLAESQSLDRIGTRIEEIKQQAGEVDRGLARGSS